MSTNDAPEGAVSTARDDTMAALHRIAHDPSENPHDDGEPCEGCCTNAALALDALKRAGQ